MRTEKIDLAKLAEEVMLEKGLQPNFSQEQMNAIDRINQPATLPADANDLRTLLWCSIDNDDSRDLDQLTYGEATNNGWSIWVAVADVDALVAIDSPIDDHAEKNTTSVYTPAKIFPMLPEKLSTNLTSLNESQDRVAMVVNMQVSSEGDVVSSEIYPALVHNHAKLTYNKVGAWLEASGEIPEKVAAIEGLNNNLLLQHNAAQALRKKRHQKGSLTLQSSESRAKISNEDKIELNLPEHNYAHQLIEEFMVAANYSMATHLKEAGLASFRRIVKIPQRWPRIVEVAANYGVSLPEEPDSKALEDFLVKRFQADPETFPDLSLTIIKLLGRGEYVIEGKDDEGACHFGLALCDYTHSTAPNRRFPDLITQRQYKAYFYKQPQPYSLRELDKLAEHCTMQEDAANKVERHLNKSAAAMFLSNKIGNTFDGIITGASDKGVWVRIFNPPVEGKVVKGGSKLDVGDRVQVKLVDVEIAKGFIDFVIV